VVIADWKKGKLIPIYQEKETFRLLDCKGRALRKVQEKDSARVKGATIAQLVAFRH
jgi:hypothetical protein